MTTTTNPYLRATGMPFAALAAKTRALISELESILSGPEFKNWGFCNGDVFCGSLMQLWPERVLDRSPSEGGEWRSEFDTVASARGIAKRLGGKWVRDGDSWHGEVTLPSGSGLRVILHRVEPQKAAEALEI